MPFKKQVYKKKEAEINRKIRKNYEEQVEAIMLKKRNEKIRHISQNREMCTPSRTLFSKKSDANTFKLFKQGVKVSYFS